MPLWGCIIQNDVDNQAINNINLALGRFDEVASSGAVTFDHYQEIIDACEVYIQSLQDGASIGVSNSHAYSELVQVVKLQKNAVAHMMEVLKANNTNESRARWRLLSDLFVSDQPHTISAAKGLVYEYYGEFKFEGNVALSNWTTDDSCTSFYDVLKMSQSQQVNYMGEMAPYELHFVDGLLVDKNNECFDTYNALGINLESGYCIYILTLDKKIYSINPDPDFFVHHSSFTKGRPVLCAGTIKAKKGQIEEITLLSGHYLPNRKQLLAFLTLLQNDLHIDLSKIIVRDHPNASPQNAREYLEKRGCFPGELSYKQALAAHLRFESKEAQYCLENAAALNHPYAILTKGNSLIRGTFGYKKDKLAGYKLLYSLALANQGIASQQALQILSTNGISHVAALHAMLTELTPDRKDVTPLLDQVFNQVSKVNKICELILILEMLNSANPHFQNEKIKQDLSQVIGMKAFKILDKRIANRKKISSEQDQIALELMKKCSDGQQDFVSSYMSWKAINAPAFVDKGTTECKTVRRKLTRK